MNILNIAGYKFTALSDLTALRGQLFAQLQLLDIKGTILLSSEGININLAGLQPHIQSFQAHLRDDTRFASIRFHEALTEDIPFKRLKIKIKKEIITMRQPEVDVLANPAPSLTPAELKKWLDEKRDFTLLDTRNAFEVEQGTFANAIHLDIKDFGEFAQQCSTVTRDKPIVMFCTGGIRCEKAALHMKNQGYENVFQLDGGILGYFSEVGNAHYQGECFVFDERIKVVP